jgi:hypothetical protein
LDSIELRNVLQKYVKAKLPTHLYQKTACLYIPAENITDIEIMSKSFEIKNKLTNDVLPKPDHLNCIIFNSDSYNIADNKLTLATEEKEGIMCLICCEKQSDAVFMDCGHSGICYGCSQSLWNNGEECHLCRKVILY